MIRGRIITEECMSRGSAQSFLLQLFFFTFLFFGTFICLNLCIETFSYRNK